jgi:C1A family cysteine protease
MGKEIVIGIVALIAVTAYLGMSSTTVDPLTSQYDAFIARFNRNYISGEEYEFRRAIFKQNLELINEHNAAGYTWSLGVNQFADMTQEEVKQHMGLIAVEEPHPEPIQTCKERSYMGTIKGSTKLTHDLKDDKDIDWRHGDYVLPIKNQGSCGSCWAFAANAGVETAYALYQERVLKKKISVPDLSEQLLVDCDEQSLGCMGGFMDTAYCYYTVNPTVETDDYPYVAKDETCESEGKDPALNELLLGWYGVERFDSSALRRTLNGGVVPVAIQAENPSFYFYESGVVNGTSCGFQLDHGVGLVAWENDHSGVFDRGVWTIRNSWGAAWGEEGHARISNEPVLVRDITGEVFDVGVCGINMQNSIPSYYPLFTGEE